jgi:hypothetical protein
MVAERTNELERATKNESTTVTERATYNEAIINHK